MYIHHRPAAAIFRLAIGALATIGVGLQFVTLGDAAWRLFSTWVMILTAIYYIVLSLISALRTRRSLGKQNSPIFEGALITANSMILIGVICFLNLGWSVPGVNGVGGILVHFIIPLMTLLDYALFCRKGRFQFVYPFDWLVLPIVFSALILISALNRNNTIQLAIPYPFLDYATLGFENFAISLTIIALLVLIFGYSLFLVDFALSGKLAKRIVLPKLKAVLVDDDQNASTAILTPSIQPTDTSSISSKPAAKATTAPKATKAEPKPPTKPDSKPTGAKSVSKPSSTTKAVSRKSSNAKNKPKPTSATSESAAEVKKPKIQADQKPAKTQSITNKSSEKPAKTEQSSSKSQAAKPTEPKTKEGPKIRKF